MRQAGLEATRLRYCEQRLKDGLPWLMRSKEMLGSEVFQGVSKIMEESQGSAQGKKIVLRYA